MIYLIFREVEDWEEPDQMHSYASTEIEAKKFCNNERLKYKFYYIKVRNIKAAIKNIRIGSWVECIVGNLRHRDVKWYKNFDTRMGMVHIVDNNNIDFIRKHKECFIIV